MHMHDKLKVWNHVHLDLPNVTNYVMENDYSSKTYNDGIHDIVGKLARRATVIIRLSWLWRRQDAAITRLWIRQCQDVVAANICKCTCDYNKHYIPSSNLLF
jgi:cytochrome b